MIHLTTSYTPGYPWAEPYRASLKANCNVPWTMLEVPQGPNADTRTGMVQHGAFLRGLPFVPRDNFTVVFTDADMICQRGFTDDEAAMLYRLEADQVAVGPNKCDGQTLEDEATTLQRIGTTPTMDAIFPGWRTLPVWNCGFIAARRSTWERLYDMSRALMPAGEAMFLHYAAVQWVLSYCIGRWLEHVPLPYSICMHGCWPPPAGASVNDAGLVCFDGAPVAFRHAINLTPAKGANL